MKPLIVLDACTILNLLRIDDENDFLLKQIKNWKVCLPSTVLKETKLHVRSDFYTKEKNEHIFLIINQEFDQRKTSDIDIKKDLSDEGFDKVVKFCGHKKRENGELYCVALALVKSREENDSVTLYTDDYKATEEFRDFYRYHCIGNMGDTLDLLTRLYWSTPEKDFQYSVYRAFLENLRAEYNHQLNTVAEAIDVYLNEKKKGKCKDRDLLENLNNIIVGYRKANMIQMEIGIHFFQKGSRYNDVKKIVADVDIHKVNRQMIRITEHLKMLKQHPVFKIS